MPRFHKRFNDWIKKFPEDEDLNFSMDDQLDGEHHGDPDFPVENVAGDKGDLLIWHSFLPHSNGTNFGSKLRMCQYITMWPHNITYWPTYRTTGDTRKIGPMLTNASLDSMQVVADDGSTRDGTQCIMKEERARRIKMWQECLPGGCYTWPPIELPDCRAEKQFRPSKPAQLSTLGRKLLGIDSW